MATQHPQSGATKTTSGDAARPSARDRSKGRGTLIVATIIVVWAVLFLVLNRQKVTVHFVLFSTRLALFWALLLAVASGIVIGLVAGRRRQNRGS
jgi:uncharacterized integral membrane protein